MRKSVAILLSLLSVLVLVAVVGAEPATPTVNFCVNAAFQGGGRFEDITITVDGRAYGSQGSTDPGEGDFFSDTLNSGDGTYCLSNPLYEGEYDFYARAADTLRVLVSDTIQFGGVDSVNMGTLPEGDINNDAAVNGTDLGLLGGTWLQSAPNLPGDLNEDGSVNGTDLGQMGANWLTSGEPAPARAVAFSVSAPTGTATVRTAAAPGTNPAEVPPGGFLQFQIIIDNPNGEAITFSQFKVDYNEAFLTPIFFTANAGASWNAGPQIGPAGGVVTYSAFKAGDPSTDASILIGTMGFTAIQGCSAAADCGVRGLDLIAPASADLATDDGTLYDTVGRTLTGFANCGTFNAPCEAAGQGLAVTLSGIDTAQPASSWVALVTVAFLLVLTTGYTLRNRAVELRR